jgi:tetratricopeptide (TPR) repeat protein
VASNLFGIANAYWGLENLSEALIYAQQALTLNESIESGNDLNIGASLAILANIYYKSGDDIRALELAKRGLILLERCVSPDSPALAPLLNNIGTIQFSMGLFNDATLTFIRVLQISEKTLPKGHPTRVTLENNIRRITQMQHYNNVNSYFNLWTFLSKISLA